MSDERHRAGRLTLDDRNNVRAESGAHFVLPGVYGMCSSEMARDSDRMANTRRLVAPWNACLGIPTADLERAAGEGDDLPRLAKLQYAVGQAHRRAGREPAGTAWGDFGGENGATGTEG